MVVVDKVGDAGRLARLAGDPTHDVDREFDSRPVEIDQLSTEYSAGEQVCRRVAVMRRVNGTGVQRRQRQ